ncbi:PREDICTED: ATP-dependent Clp protease ATP-binding subunit clpA homolog CD4A, chloroplastic-like [Erythranthe guttata]|uniref:ATP-dependent Clp protease ATP-binding subunit clpA homolog CD4A, chloroplastic-like n=1 Tax=Erythranthe guttata TaxID=4155 RepID=UPI00064D8AA5|nr:PREDICTED: ATP-dependent Clp protease ATP-binding subunit clpA homolog CD4A, chloroplastic-like [Erythranthe guttata]XP_012830170.1 PREDICTED: ATP-dependent Clp protease ATP-binding subunit clpA homolog CD4A, chloroplastic-like [Erythranthe guttata]|eukprot:XP_012830169.1 PREDICTED: ATP-dependent Clp protease ATP-binding subunit clpA homolog CD4A, chloroplastic-like [Erythranthe guttata]
MIYDFVRVTYLPWVGVVSSAQFERGSTSNEAREGATMSWKDKSTKLQLTRRFNKASNEAREGDTMSMRLKEKNAAVRLKEKKAIELQLTKRFLLGVLSWPLPLVKVVLELNMAEMVSFGEVKGGDSVIVDLDSHGKLVIIRGSSSAAPRFREPIVL